MNTLVEKVRAEPIDWTIGPFHPALPGSFRLRMKLDGEVISSAGVESGFTSKSLEGVLSRLSWLQCIPVLDRLDPEAAVFAEWAYCLALEKALGVEVPKRALGVRVLMAELTRVSAHLLNLGKIARAAGSQVVYHFTARERERVLDLLELLTGARHAIAFLRVGGVREDVSDGFLERLLESCQAILQRVNEYNDLLTYNEAFVRRVMGQGVLSRKLIQAHRITGLPARVFQPAADLRWQDPMLGYQLIQRQELNASEPIGEAGDIHHRFVLKLHEVAQSISLLHELAQHLPKGDFRSEGQQPQTIPAGVYSASVEAARGVLGVRVTSTGGKCPATVALSTPSEALFACIPDFLPGAPIEDLAIWLASLDLQIAEVDR